MRTGNNNDSTYDNRANYEWYSLQGHAGGAKGAFIYGPPQSRMKNTNTNTNTNSNSNTIRLEPLDITSINMMKSMNRTRSAPASISLEPSLLSSINYEAFFNQRNNDDYNDNNNNDDMNNTYYINDNNDDSNDIDDNDDYTPKGINFQLIRDELKRLINNNINTTLDEESSVRSLPTLAEIDRFKLLDTQKKLALASLSSLKINSNSNGNSKKNNKKKKSASIDNNNNNNNDDDDDTNYSINTPIDGNGKHLLELVPRIKEANSVMKKV